MLDACMFRERFVVEFSERLLDAFMLRKGYSSHLYEKFDAFNIKFDAFNITHIREERFERHACAWVTTHMAHMK